MDEFEYIGWIPCVNGHLDFALMKVGIQGGFTDSSSTDENIVEENFSCSKHPDSHERRIVLQSKVDWRDSAEIAKHRGFFRVVVTAEVHPSNNMDERCLSGNILIYPISAEPEELEQRKTMNIHQLCHQIKNGGDLQSHYNQLQKVTSAKEAISQFNNDYFSCSISFEIRPNGITSLKYNTAYFDEDRRSKYIIARQAFYYLKYSIHTHKHHSALQDSLTTITPIYIEDTDPLDDASLRLIGQLKRELTALKRTQTTDCKEHPTDNAVGIIAYTESFIYSLADSKFINQDTKARELHRFGSVKSSFKAQVNKINNELSNAELIKSKAKVWLGFLIVSFWGVMNFNFKPASSDQIAIANEHLPLVVISIISLILFTYAAIRRSYQHFLTMNANVELYKTHYIKIISKIGIALMLLIITTLWLLQSTT